jgi:outer membrane protein assembly factor BamB
LLAVIALIAAAITVLTDGGDGTLAAPRGRHVGDSPPATTTAISVPAIEAGLLPWQLNGPLSREVVMPSASGSALIVAGGLSSEGVSNQGVYEVDPINGHPTRIGDLKAPLHDAAGVVLRGTGYVFGGGTATPLVTTQRLVSIGVANSSAPRAASALAPLPQPRADDSAVTIGRIAYILGGYDGSSGDAAVLATTDGSSYTTVARLPIPVRYAAAVASSGKIYVFGGDATSGAKAGDPVSTVQVVDPATGHASIAGSLPEPLAAASAVLLGGQIYLAGGETLSSAAPGRTPTPVDTIWVWLPQPSRALVAGRLMVAVSHAAVTVLGNRAWLIGGETAANNPTTDVQMFEQNPTFGRAGARGAGSPYFGDKLLIADRGNNRLLLLDDAGSIVWRYPSASAPPPPGGFYFPDDAFFARHATEIISNQEENDTVIELSFPGGKVLWSYGHPRQPGSAPGYLDNPDDAYVLRDGSISVADPMNCRVLILSHAGQILEQIGRPGACVHGPPDELGSPNGDTPLKDGNLLVSEINGSWIDEYSVTGHLVWGVHLPIGYPSDPQPIGPDKYLVANYETPGGFIEFSRSGHISYTYDPSSGPCELNRPSLVEMLPSGVLMANDDYNDRMVAVDPATGALVWQYGDTGVPGTAPGLLDIPDGFDLLGPNGTYPTHPATG